MHHVLLSVLLQCILMMNGTRDCMSFMFVNVFLIFLSFFRVVTGLFSGLSVLCCLFLFVALLLSPKKRKFPQNTYLNILISKLLQWIFIDHKVYIIFACFVISINILMTNMAGGKKFLCHNNGGPSTAAYIPCAAQGKVILLFSSTKLLIVLLNLNRSYNSILWSCSY